MKANAPEKIYINPNLENRTWLIGKGDTSFIEYTRTDAFVEKACKWLENNLSRYSELTDEDEYGHKLSETVMNVFYGQAVKDFKNYMKGE